ncbi:BAZ1A protein, partial [Corythaeola cristata]|nr:BAZ1A protein [Corythaeola cristata]
KKAIIDPFLFKYKVQPIKKDLYETVIVKASQLRIAQRISVFIFLTKATSISKYNLAEQNFSYLFPDDPPTFIFSPASRRRGRPPKRASTTSLEDEIPAKRNTQGNKSKVAREKKTTFQKHKE